MVAYPQTYQPDNLHERKEVKQRPWKRREIGRKGCGKKNRKEEARKLKNKAVQ